MSNRVQIHGYALAGGQIQHVDIDEVVYNYPGGSFTVSPASGDTNTTFTVTATVNADVDAAPAAATVLVDGTPRGTNAFKLPAGTHEIEVQVVDVNDASILLPPVSVSVVAAPPPPVLAFPGDTQKGHIRWGLSQPIGDHSVPVGVHRTYFQGAGSYSSAISTARGDLAAGTVPWISIKGDGSWAQMAGGSADASFDVLITGLMKLAGAVMVTFNHEPMKVDGTPDDPGGATAFLGVCRRFRARLKALGAKNIAFGPVYMAGSIALPTFRQWWDATIFDFFGIDIYFQHGPITGNKAWVNATNFARAENKRLVIGEWGVLDDPNGTTNIDLSHDAMITAGVPVAAYFDSNANSTADWTLAGARLAAWTAEAKLPSSVPAGAS